jgi:tRNA-uridine 2-sulfurtransferase
MRVLVALSGGVDSSVAAAELLAAGHDVVGITMRLWGGDSDTGCCSVADVDDARRVAQQLGIDHLVFNFSDDFQHHVVDPYVRAHQAGVTPNPCIECNRHLKFDRLAERADALGFDAVATGHHARIADVPARRGLPHVHRGADPLKDQAYVVHMLPAHELERTLFPVGHLTKAQVRERAGALGLRTADKPDSQDVCFIAESAGGRATFLGDRIPLRRASVVDTDGVQVGEVPAVELVTLGQRRGLGLGGGPKRFVVDVDVDAARVVVGDESMLLRRDVPVQHLSWAHEPVAGEVRVQCSAHGETRPATLHLDDDGLAGRVHWHEPQRAVSPGHRLTTAAWPPVRGRDATAPPGTTARGSPARRAVGEWVATAPSPGR